MWISHGEKQSEIGSMVQKILKTLKNVMVGPGRSGRVGRVAHKLIKLSNSAKTPFRVFR